MWHFDFVKKGRRCMLGRHRWLVMIVTVSILFTLVSCSRTSPSDESKNKTRIELEIVYKKNQLCYAIAHSDTDSSLYFFNAAGQPIFDEEGDSVTSRALTPGMIVSLEYDGYVLETYPCQFSDVSEVRITGSDSNNVDFLTSQISEMFPSHAEDVTDWAVVFDGEDFLSAREKRALEMILRERWEGAVITVEPGQEQVDQVGRIKIHVEKKTDTSVTLQIRIEPGLGRSLPLERNVTASLENGTWTV